MGMYFILPTNGYVMVYMNDFVQYSEMNYLQK